MRHDEEYWTNHAVDESEFILFACSDSLPVCLVAEDLASRFIARYDSGSRSHFNEQAVIFTELRDFWPEMKSLRTEPKRLRQVVPDLAGKRLW